MRLLAALFTLLPTIALAQQVQNEVLVESLVTLDNTYMIIGASFALGAIVTIILLLILDAFKARNAKKKS